MPSGERTNWAVVVNGQGQHSIWPGAHAVPAGWHVVGLHDGEDAALDWIEAEWHTRPYPPGR